MLTGYLTLLPALSFLMAGCGSSQGIVIEPWEMLLQNLQAAWETENTDLLADCMREDFEHHLLEIYWDGYNADGPDT